VIQIWAVLALVTAILAGGAWVIHSLKESGRDECRAEHAEVARMAELRARERGDVAAGKYEAKKRTSAARERTISPQVAQAVASAPAGDCFDERMLRLLADDLSQRSDPSKPVGPVSPASAPAERE